MAIRRPLIDVIDRGLDPKLPHTKTGKNGVLIVPTSLSSPIISANKEVKENLISNERKDIITETSDKSTEVTSAKDVQKSTNKPDVKKSDKTPKLA